MCQPAPDEGHAFDESAGLFEWALMCLHEESGQQHPALTGLWQAPTFTLRIAALSCPAEQQYTAALAASDGRQQVPC